MPKVELIGSQFVGNVLEQCVNVSFNCKLFGKIPLRFVEIYFLVACFVVIFEIIFIAGTEEFSLRQRLQFVVPIFLLPYELLCSFLYLCVRRS